MHAHARDGVDTTTSTSSNTTNTAPAVNTTNTTNTCSSTTDDVMPTVTLSTCVCDVVHCVSMGNF